MENALKTLRQKQLEVSFNLENSNYIPVKNIGTGAYGVVCSAVDRLTGRKVAIKKVPNIFGTINVTKQTLREVKILRHFHHPNIIAVLDMLRLGDGKNENIYIVLNLMETDLHRIIHSAHPLSDHHVRFFMYQILRALKYIHSANIIHRDLKPSNIMVNANCQVKIGDFGMARSLAPGSDRKDMFMTQYVSTRWYRAPEILFSLLDYSYSVDVWSVGCIFGEILNRRQLFPGKDYVSQIKLIVHNLGTPPDDFLNRIPSDIIKRVILSDGTISPMPWRQLVPTACPSAIALLSNLLKICPWERASIEEALGDTYLKEFRDQQSEITCKPFLLNVDVECFSADQLREAMLAEVEDMKLKRELSRQPGCHVRASAQMDKESGAEDHRHSQKQLSDTTTTAENMLSAKMESAKIDDSSSTTTTTEKSAACTSNASGTNLDGYKLFVKAAIINALESKKIINKDDEPHKQITAQKRYLEREEKRRRRFEKREEKLRKMKSVYGAAAEVANESSLTEEDQNLLERWKKIQHSRPKQLSHQRQQNGQDKESLDSGGPEPADCPSGLQKQLADIIFDALPEMESANSSQAGKMDSAQLMETWLQATDMKPEELKDLENDISIVSSLHGASGCTTSTS